MAIDAQHEANVYDGSGDIRTLYRPGGPLSRLLPGFEARAEQAALAKAVDDALRRGEIGLCEAGTGTGKSLAYLLPAARYAREHDARVVISTHTISLQEQLVGKDIPLVEKVFPGLKSALVKGWGNYVCRLRLEARQKALGQELDLGESEQLARIALWAHETKDGTRSDLPFEPSPHVWSGVCAESDSCLRARCPFYESCHFFRDRAAMTRAHLLVVNHHLLFADVALRRELGWDSEHGVLPSYEAVILDEAHHVEDTATEYFGSSVSSLGARQLFARLYRHSQGRDGGVVPALARSTLGAADPQGWIERVTQILRTVRETENAVESFFSRAGQVLGQTPAYEDEAKRRLLPEDLERWREHAAPWAALAAEQAVALGLLLSECVREIGDPEESELLSLKGQVEALKRRVESLGAHLSRFADPVLGEHVYWLERSRRSGEYRAVRAPLDVGGPLCEWVDRQCQSVVLVSATMTVAGSFRFLRSRLGLAEREVAGRLTVRECELASPFDYARQALLAVPVDLPEPVDPRYPESLADFVMRSVSASRGRALVLFTSFALLRTLARTLRPVLSGGGLNLLVQGEEPRTRLLERLRREDGSVLLGTASFWEGVDVPGESLSLVIMTRLPFDVPTDPVAQARSEQVRLRGGSPFEDYALPRAVLKVKQGFGRLIRKASDRGVVVICDRRIVSKPYGRTFLEALPRGCRPVIRPASEVVGSIESFLARTS